MIALDAGAEDVQSDDEEFYDIAHFICECDPGIPWHISRFHPAYKMTDRSLTPTDTILRARQIGMDAGLRYVYSGNLHGEEGENTFCFKCRTSLIQRWGFEISGNRIIDRKCPECGVVIDGVW